MAKVPGAALIAVAWLLFVACSAGNPDVRLGPVAVVPGESGDDMEAAVTGTLSISPDCVLLVTAMAEILCSSTKGRCPGMPKRCNFGSRARTGH
jgi:hypothetical protein